MNIYEIHKNVVFIEKKKQKNKTDTHRMNYDFSEQIYI